MEIDMKYESIPGASFALARRFVPDSSSDADYDLLRHLFIEALEFETSGLYVIDGGRNWTVEGFTTLVANTDLDFKVQRIEVSVALGNFDDDSGRHWCAFAQIDPLNDQWDGLGSLLGDEQKLRAFLAGRT